MAPDIERISLLSTLNGTDKRIPLVKIKNRDEPVPLRRLGDGITRLFGIALALVNAKDGLLLIDEIENGLHYSLQAEIWQFIFRVARRLNVQVFATSHSWDMIEAFQEAAQKGFQSDGLLIRLQSKADKRVIPTIFDYRKLAIATREYIEVR
jgi:AAA15 family ATPase/GTPase